MPIPVDHTPYQQHLADQVRALPTSALLVLLDCAQWARDEGTLPEIAQTQEDHDAIEAIVDQIPVEAEV